MAAAPDAPPVGRRLMAGAADLLVHAAAVVAALAGARAMGVEPATRDLPALAFFLLAFSFLYTVLPLAFWGQTLGHGLGWPGGAERGRGAPGLRSDRAALGGRPGERRDPRARTLGGRSIGDRLSGSVTHASR